MIPNKLQLQSNYLQNKTYRNKYMVMPLSFNTFCVKMLIMFTDFPMSLHVLSIIIQARHGVSYPKLHKTSFEVLLEKSRLLRY